MEIVELKDDNQEYFLDALLGKEIEKTDFSISEKENFKQNKFKELRNVFSRDNILKFGLMTGEVQIPIEQTDGNVFLATINREQITKRISKIEEKQRKLIRYVHISTLQVLIKSTFLKGLDTPLELTLRDNRLLNLEESKIAVGHGNLKYGKMKFDVNLQLGLSLKDLDLDRSIILNYKFLRRNFMKEGNHAFSISYRINYALSNSHHSVEFKQKEKIFIDELFSEVLELKHPVFSKLTKSQSLRIEPSPVFEKPLISFKENQKTEEKTVFKPPKRDFELTETSKLKSMISDLAQKVVNIDKKL
uniref:Movement protein n=1 Tax=Soybean chlorotic mottle virus TaxID=10651 RepID=A0A4D6TXV5_SOCMV|nr:movement protein [Soybean chlorotic mottle virus]